VVSLETQRFRAHGAQTDPHILWAREIELIKARHGQGG
jgi:hypothetical protein